jgi:stage V sporulation protein K
MEDHQNDFVVILAGYPESMDNFIEANEGLRSQFPTIVHFDDYAPGELLSMLNLFCLKANYEIEPKAIETLRIIIAEAYESGDMNLRNARFVRNLFESLRKWQSVRIGETVDNPTIEDLKRITTADVELLKTNR